MDVNVMTRFFPELPLLAVAVCVALLGLLIKWQRLSAESTLYHKKTNLCWVKVSVTHLALMSSSSSSCWFGFLWNEGKIFDQVKKIADTTWYNISSYLACYLLLWNQFRVTLHKTLCCTLKKPFIKRAQEYYWHTPTAVEIQENIYQLILFCSS